MNFIQQYGEEILEAYANNKSIAEIAEQFNTYSNKIRRVLLKLGVDLRSRSEAQTIALESGRAKPPMLGKKHDQETKNKISDKVHEQWRVMSDQEREERAQKTKDYWESLSEEAKEAFRRAGNEAIREASKEGSKMEKYLAKLLTDEGYEIIIHKKALISNVNLEIDMLIPDLNVAIEIDGPSHFLPIWGEETLKRNIRADAEKSALLLNAGYCMIRVKDMTTTRTKRGLRIAGELLIEALKKVSNKFPSIGERLIEVEIK